MDQQVSTYVWMIALGHTECFFNYSVSGNDYIGEVDIQLIFQEGDVRVCHDVTITNDDKCEVPNEYFFSILEYDSGDLLVNITRRRTQVVIIDTAEPECGKLWVEAKYYHVNVNSISANYCGIWSGT